ncbi:hypothetical protein BZA77DRAFT_372492, partial [Pyronema omphalodes]
PRSNLTQHEYTTKTCKQINKICPSTSSTAEKHLQLASGTPSRSAFSAYKMAPPPTPSSSCPPYSEICRLFSTFIRLSILSIAVIFINWVTNHSDLHPPFQEYSMPEMSHFCSAREDLNSSMVRTPMTIPPTCVTGEGFTTCSWTKEEEDFNLVIINITKKLQFEEKYGRLANDYGSIPSTQIAIKTLDGQDLIGAVRWNVPDKPVESVLVMGFALVAIGCVMGNRWAIKFAGMVAL